MQKLGVCRAPLNTMGSCVNSAYATCSVSTMVPDFPNWSTRAQLVSADGTIKTYTGGDVRSATG